MANLSTLVQQSLPASLTGSFGFRNRLINAQGLINQRGYVSGTATTSANQYTVDRWRVVTSGQNLTFTTTANDTTFTAPAGGVEQVIEGLNLETGTYVLSWTGTATATVGGASVANGGTVSVTGGTNTTVRFSGGTFSQPQFERGNVPTSFERRDYGRELMMCQRYYQNLASNYNGFFLSSGTCNNFRYSFPLNAVMRSAPTVTFSNVASGFSATNIGGITNNQHLNIELSATARSDFRPRVDMIADSEL